MPKAIRGTLPLDHGNSSGTLTNLAVTVVSGGLVIRLRVRSSIIRAERAPFVGPAVEKCRIFLTRRWIPKTDPMLIDTGLRNRLFAETRKASHAIFKYIFAARISIKQKPVNQTSFLTRRVRQRRLSHAPVLLSSQGAVLHRPLPGSNFPGQETSN